MGCFCFRKHKSDNSKNKSNGGLQGQHKNHKTDTSSHVQQLHASKDSPNRIKGSGGVKDGDMTILTAATTTWVESHAPTGHHRSDRGSGDGGDGGGGGCGGD
ncbi:hypothetical protein AAZX31_07G130000 [Glycine max]|uniref:Uncharacterized protein n=2 Tax=Glycine subgen. Soja TaxID=1462606 RepID=I1KK41_SOYBN|nr:hypothetical protein JHK87_018380 [Glycine soja]KAG5022583.1 hypothetical protein JHK85_018925 [Glycine max]KAG5037678.1 hypothetical protein JHK86_018518 [Glycine max]KAG5142798.1 hypothetical protein JHK82_018493 [Glycine max]KAH1086776.1 hypothetical protein GYH30_018334 [Glycine max]